MRISTFHSDDGGGQILGCLLFGEKKKKEKKSSVAYHACLFCEDLYLFRLLRSVQHDSALCGYPLMFLALCHAALCIYGL